MDATRTNIKEFPAMSNGASIGAVSGGTFAGRARMASLALSLLAAAIVIAGVWGVALSFGDGPAPVAVGEAVEVPGGVFRVDAVVPEHMAPMQADKFAASGMSMSAMGMDMAPEGRERFTVEVTMTGGKGESLSYSSEDFRVSGDGMESAAPIRDNLESGTLSGETSVSGGMVFEVPERAENLVLTFADGRSVSLDTRTEGERGGGHGH
jgi:hypothetical protein